MPNKNIQNYYIIIKQFYLVSVCHDFLRMKRVVVKDREAETGDGTETREDADVFLEEREKIDLRFGLEEYKGCIVVEV